MSRRTKDVRRVSSRGGGVLPPAKRSGSLSSAIALSFNPPCRTSLRLLVNGERGEDKGRTFGAARGGMQKGQSVEAPMTGDPDCRGPPTREAFARFVPIATRWSDNDAYGHLNNVVYYSLFDSAVNAILIEAGLLDPATSQIIGVVVETNCRYYSSMTYPEPAEVGVAVEHLGRSSVRYHVAVFRAGAPEAVAAGRFTHVYVDRQTNRPFPIPDGHRELMEKLKLP